MGVGLIEVETKSPIVIVSKKGKGGFLETTEHIPSSTILGGVARKIVIDNYSNGFGNCAKLNGPNKSPKCETCNVKEKCVYNSVWNEKKLKLSYCFPFEQKTLSEPCPIPSLQTLFKSREGKSREEEVFVDGLILMALHRLSLRKVAKEETLLERLETGVRSFKKEDASVYLQNGKIKKLDVKINDSPHVAINHQFNASEKGYLYSYNMVSRGEKFTALAIGDQKLIEALKGKPISIGTGKSRGNGIVELRVVENKSLEDYIKLRAKSIKSGFEEIGKRVNKFLEKPREDLLFGTFTGLSPLPLKNGNQPFEAVARRIGVPSDQIVHLSYKRGVHIRYEFDGGESPGPTFILSSVINPGYAGVFSIKGDLEDVSQNLAEREVNLNDYHPWFGWVAINHLIHLLNIKDQVGGE
nr:hypothetical protein [Candidatus Freyarchaeota archaeon]